MEEKMGSVIQTQEDRSFDKETFKKEILSNLKVLFRKTLETATKQEIFQAVALAAKDFIVDRWIATQDAYKKQDPKYV